MNPMSIIPFQVEVAYRVQCAECGLPSEAGRFVAWPWADMPYPVLPDGWKNFNGVPYCPNHDILLQTKVGELKKIA